MMQQGVLIGERWMPYDGDWMKQLCGFMFTVFSYSIANWQEIGGAILMALQAWYLIAQIRSTNKKK